MSKEELQMIIANPFYAIEIEPSMCQPHEALVSEEDWIKGNVNLIKEIGAEKVMAMILENLKGNFVTGE